MFDTAQTYEPCSLANTGHCADRTMGGFHQACGRRMNPHKVFEVLAAVTALAAAIVWCRATLKPVAKPGLMPYASGDPNHIMYQEMRAGAEQIERGIILNRRAAALSALSALFQCLALLFKFCTRRMRRIRAASLIANLLGALKRGLCNCQSTQMPGPMPPIVASLGGRVYPVVGPPPNCTKTCESNRLPSSPAIESARCFRNICA